MALSPARWGEGFLFSSQTQSPTNLNPPATGVNVTAPGFSHGGEVDRRANQGLAIARYYEPKGFDLRGGLYGILGRDPAHKLARIGLPPERAQRLTMSDVGLWYARVLSVDQQIWQR